MRFRNCAAWSAPLLVACCAAAHAQQVTGNAFNPAISLILNGHYAHYSRDPADWALTGFLLDSEAGLPTEGLSLDETELAISANIDDKYYGFVAASIDQTGNDTSLDLEEGYIETLALPKGLKIKAGRFLSDVGYLNPIHSHAWDFDDAPLAYTAMLNGAYKDTGVQVKWVAPTKLFMELGSELLRGDAFPAAGAAHGGVGASTLFVHIGGDVGSTGSWRAGLSRLSADASERPSVFTLGTAEFTGNSDLTIADFVWKWAKNGNPRDRYYTVQAEYLHRKESGTLAVTTTTATNSGSYDGTQSGYYVQGVYQFQPRWRAGIRYDSLAASNNVSVAGPDPLLVTHDPSRISVMSDFSNSEFSRLRLQFNRDHSQPEVDNQIVFQYLMSLGAHGAHRF
ncbi:MAG: hypothetical protein ABI640_06515 [Gammaproteobacteria bacterium]